MQWYSAIPPITDLKIALSCFLCKGLLTHGPDEGLVNPSNLSTLYEAPQGNNTPVPQRIRGSRSRSQEPLHTTLFTPRAPTPRPEMATIIVVRPSVKQCRGKSKSHAEKSVFKDWDVRHPKIASKTIR